MTHTDESAMPRKLWVTESRASADRFYARKYKAEKKVNYLYLRSDLANNRRIAYQMGFDAGRDNVAAELDQAYAAVRELAQDCGNWPTIEKHAAIIKTAREQGK